METIPAIVITAWNRPNALKRLLGFLSQAHYPAVEIPLIISIDNQSDQTVNLIATDFKWPHGPKRVIHRTEKLGLKRHLLACGNLTEEYEAVIMLEDDLGVSPFFYSYMCEAMTFYADADYLAGFSLYSHRLAESNSFYPFTLADPEADVYFLQYCVSWGQGFTRKQWGRFREWYQGERTNFMLKEPEYLKKWSRESWKREFIQYMLFDDKWFVCPSISLSTNFGDPGAHFQEATDLYQVPLLNQTKTFQFIPMEESLNVYDAWFELVPDRLTQLYPALAEYEYEVDLYGSKHSLKDLTHPWVLTVQAVSASQRSWGLKLKPAERNLIHEIEGGRIHLARVVDIKPENSLLNLVHYIRLHKFHYHLPRLRSRMIHDVLFWLQKHIGTKPIVKASEFLTGKRNAGNKPRLNR